MMQHPFTVLAPEYQQSLSTLRVLRPLEADNTARRLLVNKGRYLAVAEQTNVPAALIAALDYRESNANPHCALGQGDPWNKVSVHVPAGKGPFASWIDAAVFYANYDHLNDLSQPDWTWPYVCWKGEAWNGFGPRNHGVHTGYLWAGTNQYTKGKYVKDSVWDPNFVDPQLGIIPVMLRLAALDPQLVFRKMDVDVTATVPATQPVPVGVGGGDHDTTWLQNALNHAYLPKDGQLKLDGSYGRRTREAVRSFQRFNGLEPNGLFGPITDAALTAAFEGVGK